MKPNRFRLIPVLFLLAAADAVASAPVKLPPYDRAVLPNGIVMYLVPKHESPLVDLMATIRGGAESEGPGEAGTCAMVADLLRRGTKSRTAGQFSAELDQMGARFGTDVDAQSTTISLEVLSSRIGHATELFADAILHPAFGKAEVRKQRARALDYARSLKDSPGDAAWYYFCALLFGPDHPYGRPPSGDELTLPHVTHADITNYYRRMYVGSNLILVAAGEFDVPEMRARLIRAFSPMPAGRPYKWAPAIPASAPAASRVLLVDRPGATVTNFVIGVPGISRTSPDRTALWLANTILGGGFTSVLNEALRVTSGLTYGITSSFDENRMPGAIGISSSTRTDQTGQAIDKTMALWGGLCEGGFTAEQLAAAKAYVKGSYPADNLQTSDEVAATLSDLELFGLGPDEVNGFFHRVDSVTLAQANAALRNHFCSAVPRFVLVGNAAKLESVVSRYAPQPVNIALSSPGFNPAAGGPVVVSSAASTRPAGAVRPAKRDTPRR